MTQNKLQKGKSRTNNNSCIRNVGPGSLGLSNFNLQDASDIFSPWWSTKSFQFGLCYCDSVLHSMALLMALMTVRSLCLAGEEGALCPKEHIFLIPQWMLPKPSREMHPNLHAKHKSGALQQRFRLGFLPLAIKLYSHKITTCLRFLKPFVWISNSYCAGSKFRPWLSKPQILASLLLAVQHQGHRRGEPLCSSAPALQVPFTVLNSARNIALNPHHKLCVWEPSITPINLEMRKQ